jgi:hypothetical protein
MQTLLGCALALALCGCAHKARETNLAQWPRHDVPRGDFDRTGSHVDRTHVRDPISASPVP